MMRIIRAAPAALILLTAGTGSAQLSGPAQTGSANESGRSRIELSAVRITGDAPVIDGRLDDAVWSGAGRAADFVQMRPNPGSPATERTEARVAYDERYLYVGMRMYDREPHEIASQLARRDASGIHSDWAHVMIDSYDDRRTAFRFSVTPRGVQKDVLHYDDTNEDVNWDAVWEVATAQDSLGWTAEFRIPLSQLRYSGDLVTERRWGINFGREIARRGEWSWWAPTLPAVGGMVSQAGQLRGLEGIRPVRRLEVMPYTVARATRAPGEAANPFHRSTAGELEVGGDVRYGVTSNLTLSATFNPDFGQVEADPSQVNLSAFESFFAERRPFFIEGANIFSFGVGYDDGSGETLFYSRRIGRTPQRSIDVDDGAWVARPEATRILGAAKLSGRTGGGWTLGFLNALTAAEYARVAGPGDATSREVVEPLANYSVASVTRDFREGQSGIGLLATATTRRIGGVEELDFLRREAFSGGVRARHLFADRTWEASAYAGASHVRGDTSAISRVQRAAGHYFQRPDADHVEFDPTRTTLSGALANFGLWKIGGSKVRGGVGGHIRTPGLELNDLGFQQEADQGLLFANLRYQQYEPQWIFRSWSAGINPSAMWTMGGERTWTQVGQFANFELNNFWSGGWWTGYRLAALNPVALRGGPAIRRPGGQRWNVWLNGDRRRAVNFSASAWGGFERGEEGSNDYGVSSGITVRTTPQLNLSLSGSLSRTDNPWQYVAQRESPRGVHYLFGELDQTTVSVTTRLNYTVSPTLSLQFYAQPFASGGRYARFREVDDPRATAFGDRFRLLAAPEIRFEEEANRYFVDVTGDGTSDFDFRNPDFSFRQLRSNAVVRWEYAPGSAFFLVWSQGRTGDDLLGPFEFRRDFDRLRREEATNVLLLKVSYWFNP